MNPLYSPRSDYYGIYSRPKKVPALCLPTGFYNKVGQPCTKCGEQIDEHAGCCPTRAKDCPVYKRS